MNRFAALFFLLLPFCLFAQEKPGFQPAASRFSVSLNAGAQYQQQPFPDAFLPVTFAGADIQATYKLSTFFRINVQSFIPVSDPVRAQWESMTSTENGSPFLRYNQSSVTGTFRLASLQARTKPRDGKGFQRTAQWGLRLGYFYTQQSWYISEPYHIHDVTPEGYTRYTTGYRGHSATLGIDFLSEKHTQTSTTSHHFYGDLLYAFSLSVRSIQQSPQLEIRRATVDENFRRDPAGMRIGYAFKRYGKGHFGFLAGAECQVKPIVRSRPNPDYYTLRGGEQLQPLAFALNAGITYRL